MFMRKNSLELGLKAEGRMKERKALYFMPNKSSCCFEKFRFTTQQQLLILDLSKGSQAESSSVAEKMRSCNKYHQKHECVQWPHFKMSEFVSKATHFSRYRP